MFCSEPKPFTELSVLIRKSDYSSVLQFRSVSCSDHQTFALMVCEMANLPNSLFLDIKYLSN